MVHLVSHPRNGAVTTVGFIFFTNPIFYEDAHN